MRCLQCGKRVSLLRKLTDGEFCSDEHRQAFQQQQNDLALARLIEAQRGMVKPPAKAAPAKPSPAKAKAAEAETAPPFGGFLPLVLQGVRWRRIHWAEVNLLVHHGGLALPSIEFRTRIEGVREANRLSWQDPAISASMMGVAQSGSVPGLLPAAEVAPGLPRLRASVEPLEAPSVPPADPPMASMLEVVRGQAESQRQTSLAPAAPVPVFNRSSVRWIPVRGEQDAVPAPAAGLVGIELAANRQPALVRDGVEAMPAHVQEAVSPAPALMIETPTYRPTEGDTLAITLPVAACASPAGLELDGLAPILPLTKTTRLQRPTELQAGAWALQPLCQDMEPAAVSMSTRLHVVAHPKCTADWDHGRIESRLAHESFDFWTWLEILTAPPAEQEVEPPLQFAQCLLSLPAALCAPVAARVAAGGGDALAAVSPLGAAPMFGSLQSQWDSGPYWAEMDRLTSVQESPVPVAALTQFPEATDECQDAPELQTRLCSILAWRMCEPEPLEIRNPAGPRSDAWQVQLETPPKLPKLGLRPDNAESAAGEYAPPPAAKPRAGKSWKLNLSMPASWKVWAHAPADLKWVAVGLPLILALVLYSFRGSQPKEQAGVKLASSQSQSILGTQFSSLQKVIMERAAIHLVDDFRSGLSAWEGKPGWAKSWRYGQATFLEPGQLAVYKPTVPMKDYTLEFLGQIERQGLSWVVRADEKLKSYHVLRLVITRPGPLPEAAIARYTVTDGKEGPVTTLPLPFPIKLSTMYRVRVEVRGKEITTYLQGQVVDSFTDTRLRGGGVGFFAARGEKALLRWVEVTHQYDYLGRFCALLAPYDVQAGAGRAD